MILFDKEKGVVDINLNALFYNQEAIKESLREFRGLCNGKISSKAGVISVRLMPKEKATLNVLGYEFCNYVLGLMKNNTIV